MTAQREQMMRQLLREARCPNYCDRGVLETGGQWAAGKTAKFCEWCWQRKEVLRTEFGQPKYPMRGE